MKNFRIQNTYAGDLISVYTDDNNHIDSIQELRDKIKNTNIKRYYYKFYTLNPDESEKNEINTGNILNDGNFQENYQNGQRRGISLTLLNHNNEYTPSINNDIWIGSKISFFIGFEDDFKNIFWFKKGVYFITDVNSSRDSSANIISMELSDKFSIFDSERSVLDETYSIPVGTNIEKALKDILNLNLGNGEVFDARPLIYSEKFKDKVTQSSIEVEMGGNVSELIDSLCTQLNAEYFYDVEGQLNIIPIYDSADDTNKQIIDNVEINTEQTFKNDLSFNFQEVVNKICVVGSSSNGKIIQGVAVNDNPASPLCYQRIGYRIGNIINDSNINSDVLAQDRAEYELRNKTILKTTSSIDLCLDPLYSVNNLITITDDFLNLNYEPFLINSISISLNNTATMSISCSNLNNLPFFTIGR